MGYIDKGMTGITKPRKPEINDRMLWLHIFLLLLKFRIDKA